MININILTKSVTIDRVLAQWDTEKYPKEEYNICVNSNLADIVWDLVVVFEDILKPICLSCKKGRLVYYSQEPPVAHPIPQKYIKQFDVVTLPHRYVRHKNKRLSHGYLFWSPVRAGNFVKTNCQMADFKEISESQAPNKTKNFSIVTSNLAVRPMHFARKVIIKRLLHDFPGQIDLYGRGNNEVRYKSDALQPYRFHICFENTINNIYWSEKIMDPILARCVPIYLGNPKISTWFHKEGIITAGYADYRSLKATILRILENPEEFYRKYSDSGWLDRNRELVLTKWNIIPDIINLAETLPDKEKMQYRIYPMGLSYSDPGFILLRVIHKIGEIFFEIVEFFLAKTHKL